MLPSLDAPALASLRASSRGQECPRHTCSVLLCGQSSYHLMENAPPIRIGTAGWSYKDWDGILYPPEAFFQAVKMLLLVARSGCAPNSVGEAQNVEICSERSPNSG